MHFKYKETTRLKNKKWKKKFAILALDLKSCNNYIKFIPNSFRVKKKKIKG